MPHKKVIDDLDAWLIGYEGYMLSGVHKYAEIGEASGYVAPPTLNEWRVMQATAVATDVGMLGFTYAVGVEGTSSQIGGLSRVLTGWQMSRFVRYARYTPAMITLGFVTIALSNWDRPTRSYTEYETGFSTRRQLTLS